MFMLRRAPNNLCRFQRNFKGCVCLSTSTSQHATTHSETSQHATAHSESDADVVIVGGGMVGTSLACALGCSPKLRGGKIVLLESSNKCSPKKWRDEPWENRISSITPGSQTFLQSIGVWEKVCVRRCKPYKDMHVWDSCSPGSVSFSSDDVNHDVMGHMIENSVLIESCTERADELDNLKVCYNAKIEDITLPDIQDTSSTFASVKLNNGDVINCKLLVGADGPNSYVREKVANITTYDYDYCQAAVVATLQVDNRSVDNVGNTTAWQRFLPSGPIALLPLSDDVSSLVWSTSRDHANQLMQKSDEEFIGELNSAFIKSTYSDNILTGIANSLTSKFVSVLDPGFLSSAYLSRPPVVTSLFPGSRGKFPLLLKHSTQYVKTRLALVGDSAHRIHPMAGLGVNLGFADAKRLVESIEDSIEIGEDYGCLEELLPYESDRQRHVVAVMAGINGLHQLFTTTLPPVVFARTMGFHLTNGIQPVKEQFIKFAMQ